MRASFKLLLVLQLLINKIFLVSRYLVVIVASQSSDGSIGISGRYLRYAYSVLGCAQVVPK